MDLEFALRSTGAVREFTDEPVSDETLTAVLDVARHAPSGGNRQPWHVAVIKDMALRRTLGALCQPVWNEYVAQGIAGETPFDTTTSSSVDLAKARDEHQPNPLLDNIESVPAMLVLAADLGQLAMMDKDLTRPALSGGGSIYPFAWSIMLAAHSHGLGGVMTTFLARAEVEARPLLGLPDDWAVATMICLGHPAWRATRLRRHPVGAFTTIDRFDGAPFVA